MEQIIQVLLMAQRCAHVHHWRTKSFSRHMALGELYEALVDFVDEIAEMYMGTYGVDLKISQSEPNGFSEQDPVQFIRELHSVLADLSTKFPQDGHLVNKYQELQGTVAKIKYKLEQLS